MTTRCKRRPLKTWFQVPGDETIFHKRRVFFVANVRYVEGVSLQGLDMIETPSHSVTWLDPLDVL